MKNHEIRLVGNGGQGVILATVILSEIAVLNGLNVAQSQAYGPEARGSACKAETIISRQEIGFTKVQHPTLLLSLTQMGINQYIKDVSSDCLVIIDSSVKAPDDIDISQIISLPLIDTARDIVGKIQTANIVAVGAINEFLAIANKTIVQQAVLNRVPKGTENLNILALKEGVRLAREWKKAHGR